MNWYSWFFEMVDVIAKKSKDTTQVGCVVVGPNKEIRAVGYNGFPRKVKDKWQDFITTNLPEHLSEIEKKTAQESCNERYQRPKKYLYTAHAEENAITNAARIGTSLEGCTMFLDYLPCAGCTRMIIQSGIKRIVINGRDFKNKKKSWEERWKESVDAGLEMLKEAGVTVAIYYSDNNLQFLVVGEDHKF